jgi:hypothetical protein
MKSLIVPDRWKLRVEGAPERLVFEVDAEIAGLLAVSGPSSSSTESARIAVAHAFAGVIKRITPWRLSMLRRQADRELGVTPDYVAGAAFEMLRGRLHQTIRWGKYRAVLALATADPATKVATWEEVAEDASEGAAADPDELSLALAGMEPRGKGPDALGGAEVELGDRVADVPVAAEPSPSQEPEFTAVEVRSAINFVFKNMDWVIAVRRWSPFRVWVRPLHRKAKTYFKGEVSAERREQARALVARRVLQIVNRTTRSEFENAALSCPTDELEDKLNELKKTIRNRMIARVQRLGPSGLDCC